MTVGGDAVSYSFFPPPLPLLCTRLNPDCFIYFVDKEFEDWALLVEIVQELDEKGFSPLLGECT